MNDPGGPYSDPFEDALSQSAQRAAQIASLVTAIAQVSLQRRALRDARTAARGNPQATRALDDQERAAHQQARLGWAPAHDPRWLAQADLLQAARAWAAAASYADTDPVAAAALRRCEDRLRHLHPYAMARYDRLRAEGGSPQDAMRAVAPLFARSPQARPGDPGPSRPVLDAGGHHAPPPDADAGPGPALTGGDADQAGLAEQRGRQIAQRLQAQARAAGRDELGPDELATVLETVTNLPADVIERLIRSAPGERHGSTREPRAAVKDHVRAGGPAAAQLAAESFPHTIAHVVATAATTVAAASAAPKLSTDRSRARRPGHSP